MKLVRYVEAGVLILLLGILVQGFGLVPLPTAPSAHGATISITLSGCVVPAGTCTSAGWWQGTTKNPTIVVTQGDTVKLTLSSADGNVHQFIVDVDGTGICSTTDPCSQTFTSSTMLTFTASMPPGTYDYGCTIHPAMVAVGGFVVNPSSTPDFGLGANPTSVSTAPGSAASSTITVAPINGFTGTVNLATTSNSTNLSCTLSPTSISGGSGTSMLSCTSSLAGNYLATVTGTSGSLSHSANVVYHVTGGTVGGVIVPLNQFLVLALFLGFGTVAVGAVALVLFHLRRRPRPLKNSQP